MTKLELQNENETLRDAIGDRDKEVSKWKNLVEKNSNAVTNLDSKRREFRLNEEENTALRSEVVELRDTTAKLTASAQNIVTISAQLEQANNNLEAYGEQIKKVSRLLFMYKGAYESTLKNMQGGLENAVELNFHLNNTLEGLKPKQQAN